MDVCGGDQAAIHPLLVFGAGDFAPRYCNDLIDGNDPLTYGEGADIEDLARDMALIEFPAFPNLAMLRRDAPPKNGQRV
jgi:hypothetical protein